MANLDFSDYDGLQDSIKAVMHRPNLDNADVEGAIALCEAELQRVLDVAEQEATATLSMAAGTSSVALPTGYRGIRRIKQDIDGVVTLVWTGPLADPVGSSNLLGQNARIIAIKGANLVIEPAVTDTTTLLVDYYAKFPVLSDSNTTNWILTDHPDVYLYGALKHMGVFVGADPRFLTRVTQFSSLYQTGVDMINRLDRRRRFGNMVTRTDAPGVSDGAYDVRFG